MGKKGKARQDKFYHLAKETGYRSRAAFKLLQLNRKYEFLEKSRVVIDLCAAPGSWMQVARQHMPVSSLIIGVDLFAIKPIPGCIALQEDITTEKCRHSLKGELKTWKADVVLHDGAPNVGQSWIYDAFIQNQLVLSALKLATEFLVKGGWFVTKIFRSKDYQSLMWVLQQLFKRVHSTKPQASRMESAEIFVVCQGYRAPDKLDPKFLDPKYVFKEVEPEPKAVTGLSVNEKDKPRAAGYDDNLSSFHRAVSISDFVFGEKFVDILNNATVLDMDNKLISEHPLTTNEIKECCKDIKVLGRKDLKALLNWRKAIKREIEENQKNDSEEQKDGGNLGKNNDEASSDEEEELSKVDQKVQEMEDEIRKELKRKKKKIVKEKKKLQEKMNLKMIIPGDKGPTQQETSLFTLKQIKSNKDLEKLDEVEDGLLEEDDNEDELKQNKIYFDREVKNLDSSGRFYRDPDDVQIPVHNSDDEYESDVPQDSLGFDDDDDDDDEEAESSDDEPKEPKKKVHFSTDVLKKEKKKQVHFEAEESPLLVDLVTDGTPKQKLKHRADLWFEKESLQGLDVEEDEDLELDLVTGKLNENQKNEEGIESDLDSDAEEDEEGREEVGEKEDEGDEGEGKEKKSETSDMDDEDDSSDEEDKEGDDDMEVVPKEKNRGKKRSLTAEALALGSMMIHSKKAKRDIMDDGWNRYAFNDDNLPEWFVRDEQKHCRKILPITKELVQEYRERQKEINVRPIKKVVEAKARKKRRAVKRLEKAKKKASTIAESMGISDYDKAQQIKSLYKKATQEKKKEVTYVVSKKNQASKRVHRPPGVQGRFKVVDRRMKKDDRRRKAADRKKGKKKTGQNRKR